VYWPEGLWRIGNFRLWLWVARRPYGDSFGSRQKKKFTSPAGFFVFFLVFRNCGGRLSTPTNTHPGQYIFFCCMMMKYVYKESAYIFSIIWCNIELELRCWLIYVYRREKRAVLFLTNKKYFFGTGEEFFFFLCVTSPTTTTMPRVLNVFFSLSCCVGFPKTRSSSLRVKGLIISHQAWK
jgi:hypothetical protein